MEWTSNSKEAPKMDLASLITSDVFLNLTCDLCKNSLSYFPICISGDKKNVCGRCTDGLLQESYARNEVYEALAQFIKFSCRYKNGGCTEHAVPKDMPDHEKICDYKTVKCPTSHFTKCTWEGGRTNYLHHCHDQHCDLMLKDGEFLLNLSQSHQLQNLLEHESNLFIITQKFYPINKLMEFSICTPMCEVDARQFSCEISFKTGSRNLIVQGSTTAFNEPKIVEIFLDSLKDRENTSSAVTEKIQLENTRSEADMPTAQESINEEILALLKCSVCQEYTLPPIYSYSQDSGSLIPMINTIRCSDCAGQNGKLNKFGIATNIFKESRNFNLDKIACLQNYPCKYRKSGCTFVAKSPHMKNHLAFCSYGTKNCPLSEYDPCLWMGIGKDTVGHIQAIHAKMILNSSTITENISNSVGSTANAKTFAFTSSAAPAPLSKCYVIKFADHLFRLNFMKIDQYYHWVMQTIGPSQGDFMFELEIVDSNNKRSSLIAKQPCTFLKTKEELLTYKSCYFHRDQIAGLVCNHMITFSVHVYK